MPYPRRFYRAEAFDHGEMLSRPRYGFLAAAVFTLFIGAFMGSGMTFQPKTHALVIDLPSSQHRKSRSMTFPSTPFA